MERIYVYEDHIHIKLKPDTECILQSGALPEENGSEAANFDSGVIGIAQTRAVQTSAHRPDKVYGVNVISSGDGDEMRTNGVIRFLTRASSRDSRGRRCRRCSRPPRPRR